MARFNNEMGITKICMFANIQVYCSIGKAFFTARMSIEMVPNAVIPDYIEVEDHIRDLSGEAMVIEECVGRVYDYINLNYEPMSLLVRANVSDARHMPVTVEKQSQ